MGAATDAEGLGAEKIIEVLVHNTYSHERANRVLEYKTPDAVHQASLRTYLNKVKTTVLQPTKFRKGKILTYSIFAFSTNSAMAF